MEEKTKILREEPHLIQILAVEEVGPVRIGLHGVEDKDFEETKTQKIFANLKAKGITQ